MTGIEYPRITASQRRSVVSADQSVRLI